MTNITGRNTRNNSKTLFELLTVIPFFFCSFVSELIDCLALAYRGSAHWQASPIG